MKNSLRSITLAFVLMASCLLASKQAHAVATNVFLTSNPAAIGNPWPGSSGARFYVGTAQRYTDLLMTNNLNCHFDYEAGQYETTGWRFDRSYMGGLPGRNTANPGCKHFGTGTNTVIRLVDSVEAHADGTIFQGLCDGFELRDLLLDCNAMNQPKYTNGEPKWLYVDLGASYNLNKVELSWGPYFSQYYKIEISNNSSSWGTAVFTNLAGGGGVETINLSAAVNGRYVRVHFPGFRGTNDLYQIAELKVYGTANPTLNLAAGLAAYAQEDPASVVTSGTDGNLSTMWTSGTYGMEGAAALFGSDIVVSNVTIVNFGTKRGKECFPIWYTTYSPNPSYTSFSNVVFDKVLVTSPATNNTDGLTAISMGQTVGVTFTNFAITNCLVSNVVGFFTYSSAYSGYKVVNSKADRCGTGYYNEPGSSAGLYDRDCTLIGNFFTNVSQGVFIRFVAQSTIGDFAMVSNTISIIPGAGSGAFFYQSDSTGSASIRSVTPSG